MIDVAGARHATTTYFLLVVGFSDSCNNHYSNHFREMATLGSVVTVHSGDHGQRHLCSATGEKRTPRKTTRFCGLRRFPHSGLRAPVPDVAGSEPLVEKFLLDGGAGLLEQGSEVPEHAHIELENQMVCFLRTLLKMSRWNPSGSG